MESVADSQVNEANAKKTDKKGKKNDDVRSCLFVSASGINEQLQCLLQPSERELRPDRFKPGSCLLSASLAFRQARELKLREFICVRKARKMIKACQISS